MSKITKVTITDPKVPTFAGPCPRCGGGVPNDKTPGAYPGAVSRYDNETMICSACGTSEAMNHGHLIPFDEPLVPLTNPPVSAHIELQTRTLQSCSACGSSALHHVAYVIEHGVCVV